MKVYQRIREYIKNKGLTQTYVAKQMGYTLQTFNAMMNGKRKVYADDIIKLCKITGAEPNDFIKSGEDEPDDAETA